MGVFFQNEKVVIVLENGLEIDPKKENLMLSRDQRFALRVINLDANAEAENE